MGGSYFFFYAEASVVCILLFGMLLMNDRSNMNRQEKQIVFGQALLAHILYFASDAVWAGIIAGYVPRTHFSVVLMNYINFILLSAIAYNWARFAAVSERAHAFTTKRGRLLFRLPFAVMVAVITVAYLIAPHFWVSESGELNDLYYPLMLAAPLFYVVNSCIKSLKNAKKAVDPAERKLFRMIGLYPLAIVFFGIVQLAYIQAPLFCFGCAVMMMFFYIRSMNDQISLDPLTKINNRGQLLRYAALENASRREDVKTFVIMADANEFKHINDTYGHAEGDRALVLIAETLKTCLKAMRHTSFLCRFGGDEFALIVHAEQTEAVEFLIYEIRRCLDEISVSEQLPYPLSVSIGFDEWEKGRESFQDCLQHADEKLYEEKRNVKQSGRA